MLNKILARNKSLTYEMCQHMHKANWALRKLNAEGDSMRKKWGKQ